MSTNRVVLTYHDAVIRQSDIDILNSNSWLTDSIIGFYLEYLEKEVHYKKSILFISPEVTQCIKIIQFSEIKVFLDPLLAKTYQLIFFPLNNSESYHSSGGSHWSLLVYHRTADVFYHFDSSSGINDYQSKKLIAKLRSYFNSTYSTTKDLPCLQQSNGYDCGIHLLCNVDNIAKHFIKYRTLDNIEMVDRSDVKLKRASILSLIYKLRKK